MKKSVRRMLSRQFISTDDISVLIIMLKEQGAMVGIVGITDSTPTIDYAYFEVVNPETGEILAYADEYTIWQLLTIKGMIRDDSLYVSEAPRYSGWIHWKDFDVSKFKPRGLM